MLNHAFGIDAFKVLDYYNKMKCLTKLLQIQSKIHKSHQTTSFPFNPHHNVRLSSHKLHYHTCIEAINNSTLKPSGMPKIM